MPMLILSKRSQSGMKSTCFDWNKYAWNWDFSNIIIDRRGGNVASTFKNIFQNFINLSINLRYKKLQQTN